MLNISALEKLVFELSKLPGIGPKTAQRLAYHLLKASNDDSVKLADALQKVRTEVHICSECFNYTDQKICHYCNDPHRQDEILCIVEEPSDIVRVESSGAFRGRYHVLHGVISPLDGIGPEDLKIADLLARVNNGLEGVGPRIREIIMALDADLEGDTTILYLAKQFQEKGIKISRVAHGIPIGGDIDYIDDRTMGRALENRIEL